MGEQSKPVPVPSPKKARASAEKRPAFVGIRAKDGSQLPNKDQIEVVFATRNAAKVVDSMGTPGLSILKVMID